MATITVTEVPKEIVELAEKLAGKHEMSKPDAWRWFLETGVKRQGTLNSFNSKKGKAEKKAAKPKIAAKSNGHKPKSNGHAKPKAAAKPAKKAAKPAETAIIDDLDA